MPEFTKPVTEFFADAEAAGYTVLHSAEDSSLVLIGRRLDGQFTGLAQIWILFNSGKGKFYKAEPFGGARSLNEFWSLKGLRERLNIRQGHGAVTK